MGYLDNRTITVDAILTKKGRELLSKGHDFFKITKFALADDEVDYRLWDTVHPSGSNYYGYAIEQMPILEAPVDETQVMRYKLVSLDKSTVRMPVVTVTPTTANLRVAGDTLDITPNTLASQGVSFNQTLGYTCILHNSDAADLFVIATVPNAPAAPGNPGGFNPPAMPQGQPAQAGAGIFLSDSELAKSVWVTGLRFRIVAKSLQADINTTITIVGNESGGSATMSLRVYGAASAVYSPKLQSGG